MWAGQPIMEVDVPVIDANGKDPSIPIVITNIEDNKYKIILRPTDSVEAGKTILYSIEKL